MPHDVSVPRLGWSMEEGVFGGWLKHDGALVKAGEPLYLLEAEKATQEIESLDAGVLMIPPGGPKSGDTVRVGQVLARIVTHDEPSPRSDASPDTSPASPPDREAISAPVPTPLEQPTPISYQLPENTVAGITRRPERPVASPRARRLAREMGVDLAQVAGTGRGGRVRQRDLPTFRSAATAASPDVSAGEFLPHTPIRQTIASRLAASWREVPLVTLHSQVDVDALVMLREQFRLHAASQSEAENLTPSGAKKSTRSGAEHAASPSYTALIVKLSAGVLREHRRLLAQWREQGTFIPRDIDISVAIDTPQGLVAPVLKQVDRSTLREVASGLGDLILRARAGRLRPQDFSGGGITITNLGGLGVDAFTPLVSLPQSCILGLGRIAQQPAVVDGKIVPRWQITLSLSFDHRVIDGAEAARFLQALAASMANPAPRLIS